MQGGFIFESLKPDWALVSPLGLLHPLTLENRTGIIPPGLTSKVSDVISNREIGLPFHPP